MSTIDYDQLAADYARHRRVQPALLAALLNDGAVTAASVVGELGCGTGNYIGAVSDAVDCDCWGVEPSAAMLNTARTRFPHIRFAQARGEEADLPSAHFDLLYSVDVIHHVADVAAFFATARHALRPGGRLCTATDAPEMIARRLPLTTYFPGTIAADQARYPTPATLRAALDAAGFRDIQTSAVVHTSLRTDIGAFRDRAYSCLYLISDDEFAAGLARMEADLARGPLIDRSEYLLLWATRPA